METVAEGAAGKGKGLQWSSWFQDIKNNNKAEYQALWIHLPSNMFLRFYLFVSVVENASELFLDFPEWVLTKHQRCLTWANVICAKKWFSFECISNIFFNVWSVMIKCCPSRWLHYMQNHSWKTVLQHLLGKVYHPLWTLRAYLGRTITDDCAILFFLSLFVFCLLALWVMILHFSLPFFIYINQVQSSSTLFSVNDAQSKVLETSGQSFWR